MTVRRVCGRELRMKPLRLLISVLLVSMSVMFAADSPATKNVDVEQFDKLRQNKANVILDVRTEREFNAGHIPGATLVDVNSPNFNDKTAKLDKSKTYLVHCASGVRSAKACQKLEAAGFTNIVHLPAGFQGWKKAGKPIEK
jgi:rhodanese-related sulfurtransferase